MALVSTLAFACVVAAQAVAQGEAWQDANRLFRQGQLERALERVDAHLKTQPKDARGRFLKGLILAEQRKPEDAIRIFNELTQDFPELPEPYNNLAVLYASQGQYDKARAALEMAIRTHPSYATAHENLGDIYAKMASQAYGKALQLDKSNTTAQTKLNLIKDLFTGSPGGVTTGATQADATRIAVATPAPKPPVATQPEVKPAAPVAKPAPVEKPTPIAKPVPVAKPVEPKPPAKAPRNPDAVLKVVNGWARAWSDNDIPAYLSHYAPDFKTPKGQSRADWEAQRRSRIAKPRQIQVDIVSPKVVFNDNGRVTVTFLQHYRSDVYKASSTKTLVMVRAGDKWLIQQERVGG